MYSGETTVTNEQLEGVLKAGDILRVRGLWRSNSGGSSSSSGGGSSSSKKENIQSNNQKIVRDKREQIPAAGNHIQKIKLIQPSVEQLQQQQQQQNQESTSSVQNTTQQQSPIKTYEKKIVEKNVQEKVVEIVDGGKITDEVKSCEQQMKNKENVGSNRKRKNTCSDVESNKSKSDVGESVSFVSFLSF